MISLNELYIINYCHPNCKPFQNIMRLSKQQAYAKAKEMAEQNPKTTAFYRFADFQNYYPLRMKTDEMLLKSFISLGGKPKEKHPLSLVLNGSEYLGKWFESGITTRIPFADVLSEPISFTYGDSCAVFDKTNEISVITIEMLLCEIQNFDGSLSEYLSSIENKCHYIEVQLWSDDIVEKFI